MLVKSPDGIALISDRLSDECALVDDQPRDSSRPPVAASDFTAVSGFPHIRNERFADQFVAQDVFVPENLLLVVSDKFPGQGIDERSAGCRHRDSRKDEIGARLLKRPLPVCLGRIELCIGDHAPVSRPLDLGAR